MFAGVLLKARTNLFRKTVVEVHERRISKPATFFMTFTSFLTRRSPKLFGTTSFIGSSIQFYSKYCTLSDINEGATRNWLLF